ncbi:MAG: hypothetical protein ABEJ27_05220 [Halodesulfurarchaeum sp.]
MERLGCPDRAVSETSGAAPLLAPNPIIFGEFDDIAFTILFSGVKNRERPPGTLRLPMSFDKFLLQTSMDLIKVTYRCGRGDLGHRLDDDGIF